MKFATLIPYPFGAGATKPGAEQGPTYLKQHGLDAALAALGVAVSWHDDPEEVFKRSPFGHEFHSHLPPRGSPERRESVLLHCAWMRDAVMAALAAGQFPVTLGGDHTMAAGSIAGVAKACNSHGRTGLIWIDAHGDANTPQTSPSQAFHGMPVAALMGMGDKDFRALGGNVPVIKPEHIVYIGARDLDEGEINLFREKNIRVFGMDEIRRLGMDAVFREAARIATKGTERLCMSIDLDAFDPADAPATGSLTPDGLRRNDTLPALAALAAQVDFDLVEIVEFNPSRGGAELTFDLIRDLLAVILKAQAARRNSTAA